MLTCMHQKICLFCIENNGLTIDDAGCGNGGLGNHGGAGGDVSCKVFTDYCVFFKFINDLL